MDHTYYVSDAGVLVHNSCKPSNPVQMQSQVKKGQAPKEVLRVDSAHTSVGKPHVHFKNGTALNTDGTISHQKNGIPVLTKSVKR